ncbi:hypothetical protein [Lysobacter sp. CA199]|uniref:hypothetical protein n=1 Tax=Lysobacter sp. CA199 TaxID=3455608 RepID=UPI003F8D066F
MDCNSPDELMMAFRNTTRTQLKVAEGSLPWNNRHALNIKAFLIKEGKALPADIHAPIADYMRYIHIAPNEVLSGGIRLEEIVRNFSQLSDEGDIVMYYEISPTARSGRPNFVTQPGTILIPQRSLTSRKCPTVILFR